MVSRTKKGPASSEAAEKIAELQGNLGITTQEAFALTLGVSHVTLINWRKGKAEPGAHNYIQLAKLAKDFPALAMWFWERAGVDRDVVGDLLPEFQRSLKRSDQHVERMLAKSPQAVISLPLLKTTAYLHAPATAPAEEIEDWIPVPSAFVLSPKKTSLVRVSGREFLGGEELWIFDSSETRMDALWGRLVLVSYSVSEPTSVPSGEVTYQVEPPGGVYPGFLHPFSIGKELIPVLTHLQDVRTVQTLATESHELRDSTGKKLEALDGFSANVMSGHFTPLPPDQDWHILGAVVGYLGSVQAPTGDPLHLPQHSSRTARARKRTGGSRS